MPRTKSKRTMSAEHKAAITEAKTVRRYLEALESFGGDGRRPRRRSREAIGERLSQIDAGLVDAGAFERLHLLQEKLDLSSELADLDAGSALDGLAQEFVAVAKSYSERKGIAYQTWRAVGVPAAVLREAGVSR